MRVLTPDALGAGGVAVPLGEHPHGQLPHLGGDVALGGAAALVVLPRPLPGAVEDVGEVGHQVRVVDGHGHVGLPRRG